MKTSRIKQLSRLLLLLLFPLILASCNLGGNPEQQLDVTEVPTNSANPTRTPLSNNNFPTSQAATQIPIPTSSVNFSTSVAVLPPTFTPLPVSIAILSPIPGNVVAGNLQVLGAASHPLFLQYQVEFGPDPNPNNLWFPITGVVQAPVTTNGLLGIWNTMTTQDGIYQLRLRVFLRDGTDLSTVVNNIRIQNQAPTPVPTSTQTIPRPIAAFTQDLTTGNAPLVVRFINQSNGAIDSYTWNFGDRSTSAEINPSHTFTTPGVYTVTLTVTGPGGSSNVSRVINVQSTTAPVAAFTQDRTSGPSPLAVQFTNQSTGNITAYEWNFGDGQTSNAVSPAHTFVDVGTYNVILRVLGPGGSSTVTRQITVQNPQIPAPDAVFTPNTTITGNTPLQVQFENASTGDITGYTWNFGDNTPTSNQESPLHTFTTAGTYTVQLTVVGPGGQDTAQVVVEAVQPPDAPVASFTINGLSSDRIPMTVTFNNTTSGEVDDYLWDFGDGTTSDSTESLITHEYTAAGTYTIKLTASNESGSTEFTETITALPPLVEPDALFTANPTSGPAPLTVEFQNQSAGDNLSFEWNFGDGSPLSTTDQAILTHEYTQQGTYTVQLTASNPDEGLSDSFQLDITVSEEVSQVDPIQANFTAAESSPLVVDFSATASGGDSNYTYEWDFGDGNIGTGQLTQHTYATEGDYTVTLTISDSASTTPAVSTQIITVSPPPVTLDPLQISFTTTESSPLTVDFNATISGGDGNYTVAWDFGDGNVGNGITTQHPYAAGGTYTVNVTVTDTANSTPATASQQVTVTEALAPLQISFTATESSPLTVDFNATISGGDGNYTVAWDFGDGNV
ncbi:MAG: PKD domain-containing protein, partial [Aggregatilineales bacterium]